MNPKGCPGQSQVTRIVLVLFLIVPPFVAKSHPFQRRHPGQGVGFILRAVESHWKKSYDPRHGEILLAAP